MENRRIGSLEGSVIGVGCNNFGWRIDECETTAVVFAALDEGINFFDTADSICISCISRTRPCLSPTPSAP